MTPYYYHQNVYWQDPNLNTQMWAPVYHNCVNIYSFRIARISVVQITSCIYFCIYFKISPNDLRLLYINETLYGHQTCGWCPQWVFSSLSWKDQNSKILESLINALWYIRPDVVGWCSIAETIWEGFTNFEGCSHKLCHVPLWEGYAA